MSDDDIRKATEDAAHDARADQSGGWEEPDRSVADLNRRRPPKLPLDVFGKWWADWIYETAVCASCRPDYVAAPLLASASVLIGHARWAEAVPGWIEPPHLWVASVGDSGDGKSPGFEALQRYVLPVLEQSMRRDFPDKMREWKVASELNKVKHKQWEADARKAEKAGRDPPDLPDEFATVEPQAPRLMQSDVTIEKLGSLLAAAAPKGVLIIRDELTGWIKGMTSYNEAGRAFFIEAYGGRPYLVERQSRPDPICIPRLAVGVFGTVQPDRLAQLIKSEPDDGFMSRILWAWPSALKFQISRDPPLINEAIYALDRLRELEPRSGEPVNVKLTDKAVAELELFGQDMQVWQHEVSGLLRSAIGKARGLALRLSLVLEFLYWAAKDGADPPPDQISLATIQAAEELVEKYFIPMAERVYGDAAISRKQRRAATLARWIKANKPNEVHVRHLQREVLLEGLRTADDIHEAAEALVEADWLKRPVAATNHRTRQAYRVNPLLWRKD
jgi:hypothetical protein